MSYLVLALVVLAVIVWVSLNEEMSLPAKVVAFLGLGIATYGGLWMVAGETGHHVLHEVFQVDYPQFITVPLATVLIAALGLFAVVVLPGARIGWFLLIVCPLAGNIGTTWALVPLGFSLVPVLKGQYPDRWLSILMCVCIFSMNFMALGTLAADPPQAYWAVKVSQTNPLGFFFPLTQFWPYLFITWTVYFIALRRLGVRFGHVRELFRVRPAHYGKALYGLGIAACVAFAITFLQGYQVPMFLGTVCILAALSSSLFGHHARHNTVHWSTETVTIFVAFFSVVALAHTGLHYLHIPNQGMIAAVIGLTLGADNAAAFASAYPQYAPLGTEYQVWYNLFNSVTYGGISPLGNGPQIVLFLVILTSAGHVTRKQVFVTWFKEACVFAPYLLVWTLSMSTLVEFGYKPTVATQLLTGLIAMAVCLQFMDLQRLFQRYVDEESQVPEPMESAHIPEPEEEALLSAVVSH